MLVEVNLLPRKEFKNRAIFLIVTLILIVVLGGGFYSYTVYNKVQSTDKSLSTQIAAVQEQRATEEKKFSADQESTNVINLEKTVKWADDYFVETVPLLNHLSGLLPERGFIQAFSYVEDGIVSLVIQFDTNTEIAHYIASLNASEYIDETKLNSVVTSSPVEEEETTEQPVMETQPVTEPSDNPITVENPTDPIDQASVQTTEQAVENQTTTEKKEKDKKEYIPRYLAQFELKINKDALKTLQKEGN
ncbi:PilN domain-containing protein [Fredinandcohnia sp. 179-A 10B2 NHS]|uniref:PilN domain-containing protein n=1 Tax=Fredinandcohnia sp. 179-A 10B2 NHS TaxID=3235176 RepID=UPI0039A2AC5B